MSDNLKTYPPLFIGGAGRSGTTLLRVMIDSHPEIACGPEIKIFGQTASLWKMAVNSQVKNILGEYGLSKDEIDANFRNFCFSFIEKFRKSKGASMWAEKTPTNISHLPFFMEVFPGSRFIHMIRDGRDVVSSLIKQEWTTLTPSGKSEKIWYTKDIVHASIYWKKVNIDAIKFISDNPSYQSRYMRVFYEDLVNNPEKILNNICDFLNIDFSEEMLNYHDQEHSFNAHESSTAQVRKPLNTSSIGRWKKEMSQKDKEDFYSTAGGLLKLLKYD
ncbi:MAG: sulfotransferase family protein [Fibrobacterota bacterium]